MSIKGGMPMVERKSISPAQKKQEAAQIWLSYNRVLYEKGIISEQERSRMMLKIDRWQLPSQTP